MCMKRLSQRLTRPELEEATALALFARDCYLETDACERLEYVYWDLLHSPAVLQSSGSTAAGTLGWQASPWEMFQNELRELGAALSFSTAHLDELRLRLANDDPDEAQ